HLRRRDQRLARRLERRLHHRDAELLDTEFASGEAAVESGLVGAAGEPQFISAELGVLWDCPTRLGAAVALPLERQFIFLIAAGMFDNERGRPLLGRARREARHHM